jgi:O-antigen ligase
MTLNNSIIEKILLTLWVIIIVTINSKYEDFSMNNLNLVTTFNFTRYFLPIILFPLIIYFVLREIKKIKIDFLLILFILFGCIQLLSFVYNLNLNFYSSNFEKNILDLNYQTWNFENIILLTKYFYLIFLFILFQHYSCNFNKIFSILFIIILFITIFFFSILLREFILNENNFYFYGSKELLADYTNNFIMQTNPRVTGLGRNLLIILCVLIFIYNDFILKKSLVLKIIFFFLIFLSVFLIWGTQSRGVFLCLLLISFIFLFFDKKNLKYKIIFSITIFIFPILLFEKISELKYENYLKKYKFNDKTSYSYSRILNPKNLPYADDNRDDPDYSTGRTIIWKRSLNFIFQKPWIGYGPQGDRIALSNNKKKSASDRKYIWDNNSSNALIYSLLSGGIFGFSCFVVIYLLIIKKIVNLIFKYSVFDSSNYSLKVNISIIAILLLRSTFENGFAFFGIDLIFLITCFYFLKSNYSKFKK